MEVFDVDGDKIGTVHEVVGGEPAGYMKVPTGLLGLGGDRYIPLSAVREVRRDGIYLTADKDDAEQLGWHAPPTPTARERQETISPKPMARPPEAPGGSLRSTEGEQHIELREEELRARTEQVEAGEVRLRKEIVSQQQTLEVPVTREELDVERHPVTDPTPAQGEVGDGEEIRVPLQEECVHLEKETVATEEVRLGRRPVTETEHVTGTVRKEEAHVEREGDVTVRTHDDERARR
jgi:uncharacterized protein (TIGR02271 family)